MGRCVVELPREHAGRFVAYVVGRGCRVRVLAAAAELEELLEKLRRRGLDPRHVVVDYVPAEPVHLVV